MFITHLLNKTKATKIIYTSHKMFRRIKYMKFSYVNAVTKVIVVLTGHLEFARKTDF